MNHPGTVRLIAHGPPARATATGCRRWSCGNRRAPKPASGTTTAALHHGLAYLYERQDRIEAALRHAQQALALHRAAGGLRGQAGALNAVGWCHTRLGNPAQALIHCEEALELYEKIGNRYGQAAAWDSLGYANHHLADYTRAAECYRQALALSRDLGDRYNEADTLSHLGDTQLAAGDDLAARATWTHALSIFTELDHPSAARLRARLDDFNGPVPSPHS
jgi:tetratricopeptide (TPR) repeat protein